MRKSRENWPAVAATGLAYSQIVANMGKHDFKKNEAKREREKGRNKLSGKCIQ